MSLREVVMLSSGALLGIAAFLGLFSLLSRLRSLEDDDEDHRA